MLDTLRGSIGNPELDGELDFILFFTHSAFLLQERQRLVRMIMILN